MTTTPRGTTPTPTLPPTADEKPLLDRLLSWKPMLAAAAFVFAAGVSFAVWQRDLATKADVERERQAAGAALDKIRIDTNNLRERMPVVEKAMEKLTIIEAQLFEIAVTVGARQVVPMPAPQPQPQITPAQGPPP